MLLAFTALASISRTALLTNARLVLAYKSLMLQPAQGADGSVLQVVDASLVAGEIAKLRDALRKSQQHVNSLMGQASVTASAQVTRQCIVAQPQERHLECKHMWHMWLAGHSLLHMPSELMHVLARPTHFCQPVGSTPLIDLGTCEASTAGHKACRGNVVQASDQLTYPLC